MADKWEAYYSRQFLPWDSGTPSSQLTAFLTSCLPQPLACASSNSNNSEPPSLKELISQAATAPVALPPEATAAGCDQQLPQLHACERCAAFKPRAGGSVLELGCGTGASAVWLARQGFQVTGVDIVQAALDAASSKAAAAGLPEIGPAVLSGEQLLAPLVYSGLVCVFLRQSRFDSTPHYVDVLGKRPLACLCEF
ncbi:hypothetical protein OEZ86_006782 [Tetradesmus obliquus]|nr:hypothetical protein OEZ86_006782 [Tetradesmus obliquus]